MVFKCWICTKCNVLTLSSYFSHFHEYLCWPQQFCIFYFFVRCYYLYILVKIYLGAHCFESAVSYSVSRESSKSYMVFIVTFLLGTLLSFLFLLWSHLRGENYQRHIALYLSVLHEICFSLSHSFLIHQSLECLYWLYHTYFLLVCLICFYTVQSKFLVTLFL